VTLASVVEAVRGAAAEVHPAQARVG
jgi:hypothetical protein